MLQRHQKNNLDQIIAFARDELSPHLPTFRDAQSRLHSLSQTASKLLQLHSATSYPLISLQILKQSLTNAKHPHALQIELILDKAEIFYLESVRHDLSRLTQQQKIQHLSQEDITSCIQEINWKMGYNAYEREEILNQSIQIEENMELMKFFQGVRSYQNWEENLEKRVMEGLRGFGNQAWNLVTLKKGYFVNAIDKIYERKISDNTKHFLKLLQKNKAFNQKLLAFQKVQSNKLKTAFNKIKTYAQQKSLLQQKFFAIAIKLKAKANHEALMKFTQQLNKTKRNVLRVISIFGKVKMRKQLTFGFQLFKKIKTKSMLRWSKIGAGLQKLQKSLKKQAVKQIAKSIQFYSKKLTQCLQKMFIFRLSQSFSNILQYIESKKALKQAVSYKIKGRILLSIQRYQSKPINIRKSFLNWYLKAKQQKYAKMIYNIWLNGSTSKFTYFMRMKNCIHQAKKVKIRQELKMFLLILIQKYGAYYNTCQKGFLTKWLEFHRYCKKLHLFLNKLSEKVSKIDQDAKKDGLKRILDLSKRKVVVTQYFNTWIKTGMGNQKASFSIWKKMPKVKKVWGKQKFLHILRDKLNQTEQENRQIYSIFKRQHIVGQNFKIKFMSKMFTKDFGYLATFLNIWRRNVTKYKTQSQNNNQKTQIIKTNQSKNIYHHLAHLQSNNLKQVFNRIVLRGRFLENRKLQTRKILMKIFDQSEKNNLEESFGAFRNEYQNGKNKKQKLVRWLVQSCKVKQLQSLHIWLTTSQVQKQSQKKTCLTQIFNNLNSVLKSLNQPLISKKPLFGLLTRIIQTRSHNISLCLQSFKKIPKKINRSPSLQLFSLLDHLVHKDKLKIYQKFKQNNYNGQYKKKKIMDFMFYQYIDCTKKYFKIYLTGVREMKMNDKYNAIGKVFQSWGNVEKGNFDVLYLGDSVWKKKAQGLSKFNDRLVGRVRDAFLLWLNTAKSLTYFNSIKNQKKIRYLGIINEMLSKNKYSQTKKCIHLFKKNSNITQLQTNFLKRLCDTQAGKVIKALMIWKNLPKPKNKQLVAKASKFERNLYNYFQKTIRLSYQKFKDEHYFGNDRKKLAIRNLVAKSCTGIQKYFDIWKKNNKLITLFSQCHKIQAFMEIAMRAESKNFAIITQGNRSEMAKQHFKNIQNWWMKNLARLFNVWRNKTMLVKQGQQLKASTILKIAQIQKQLQTQKIKKIILKMKKLLHLKNILSRNFLQRQKNNILSSFNRIRTLPDHRKITLRQHKAKAVIAFYELMDKEVRNEKMKIYQFFRDQKYQGNYRKLKSCQAYLKDRISEVHKIINLWQNMANQSKKKDQQNKVDNLFQSSFSICRSNFLSMLESVKLTQIKKRCFDKLFSAMEIKKKGLFIIWRSKVKEIKMNKMLDNANKKSILQKINKLLHGTSTQNVKRAIRNFHHNSKITQIQVKFIQRLLQTKSGKVLEAFSKWKKIPNQNLMQKARKGQKFYYKLQSLLKSKLSETYSGFTSNGEQGSLVKKQSVLQLLDITSSGIRRYYNRWIRITKRDHTLKQAYSMMHSLDALQHCLEQNYIIVFEDQRSTRVKTWAIERLIAACGENVGTYFRRWRQGVRERKMQEEIEKKEKSTALKIFTNVLGGSQTIQIKNILEKFHKNLAISKISKNFITRLLKTKSGKVVQLFQLWKSIPDAKVAKKKKKAIKFESNLNKMYLKFLKSGYQPFKVQSHQARNRKRMCIEKLIRASMGQQKKKFLLWRQIVKQQKMLAHTSLFDNIFQKMNKKLTDSLSLIIKSSSQQITKKKNLCRRLINNSNFAVHHAYFIWREALQIDNIKIQKIESNVKLNLLSLLNIHNKVECKKLLQIISAFKNKYNFRNKLTADIRKQEKNRKGILFYQRLAAYVNDKVGVFLKQLIKSNKEMNFIRKNNAIQGSFGSMMAVFAENFQIVVRSNRQTVILERALNKIFDNLKLSTQKAFNLWREYKNILALQIKMTTQKKKNVLQILNRCLKNSQTIKIPFVIQKFEKNYKSIKLRKQILQKILRSKAGKVPLSFMIWKSLPNPGAKKLKQKAMKFQAGLARLVNKGMKQTYEKFRNESYEGNNKKKYAVRKLILVTMSDSNRYFNTWRKVNNQAKIAQKLLSLQNFFQISNQTFSQNIPIFSDTPTQIHIKTLSIQKLVQTTSSNLRFAIQSWHSHIKTTKFYILDKVLHKFSPPVHNTDLIFQSFSRIRHKADKETLRLYINSLWKWKISNVQANYYAKFIKIFKESQELIILSNCINRKRYGNLHWAFRRIGMEGHSRFQKKVYITEKYLQRKINNYYQRFKLNAYLEQIHIWKTMYKNTIKGKKLIQLIQKFARKQLFQAYYQINNIKNEKNKIEQFAKKVQNFKLLLLQKSFAKIQASGIKIFAQKLSLIFSKIKNRILSQSILILLKSTSLSTLVQKISAILKIHSMRHAFQKIHGRATLSAKYRLAINFISYAQGNVKNKKIYWILNCFKKNQRKMEKIKNFGIMLYRKEIDHLGQFFRIGKDGLEKKVLLSRFKKAMLIKKILDKEDSKLMKKYFDLMKKKKNKWVTQSIRKFIVRSDLKSSLAVSLWRLKNYQESTTKN